MDKIFLHFLNRELLRSLFKAPPKSMFEDELKVLTCASEGILFTNFANTLEGGYLESLFFRELISHNLINFYGEKQTLEEYWFTREQRYKFDEDRYPYLSQSLNGEISIEPIIVRDFSMTKKLKTNLFDTVVKKSIPESIKINSEQPELIGLLKKIVTYDSEDAVTISLALRHVDSVINKQSKDLLTTDVGKILSTFYLKEILENLNADISTGIRGVIAFDHLSKKFPKFDIPILQAILTCCGIKIETIEILNLISFRFSLEHKNSVRQINIIISTLYTLYNNHIDKYSFRSFALKTLYENAINKPKTIELSNLPIYVNLLDINLKKNLKDYEHISLLNKVAMKTILILTATTKESIEVHNLAKVFFGHESDAFPTGGHVVNFLGISNSYKIYHAQCEAGSVGPVSAQAVASDLIDALAPSFILMPGIAFGLQKNEQKISDILVASHIFSYERQRLGEDKIIPRGEIVPSSPLLLSLLRNISLTWTKSKMHFGIIMSGEKLVDNSNFVKGLLELCPEAIGGEMEGAGLYAAAYRKKVDWILFKSIVDWGMTKTDEHQVVAANYASEVLFKALAILTK